MQDQHHIHTHYRTCHLCEAMCGLEIRTKGEDILSIRGDEQDIYSKGHICPKALALQDIHQDANRLKFPMRRTPGGWQQITWEEAFAEVASRLHSIRKQYGKDAIGIYTGNPTVHNTGTILYLYDFANAVGTRNRFASHSLDQLPQMFVNGEMFGHQAMFPIPDLDHTDYFLMLGANPMVSNGSVMSTPDIRGKLRSIRERGGKIIVIDPCRTRTAKAADGHYFIRPGTDVLFLLGFLATLFEERLLRKNHVFPFTDGFEELERLVRPFAPEAVAHATGIPSGEIRQLARSFSAAPRAVCYGRLGVSTQAYGGLCHWLINTINLVTGNLDREGGAMFTRPAVDFLRLLRHEAKALRWHSRVRGLPETAGDLPTAAMAEEILTPGQGQVRALITVAGNPVLSAPNSHLMEEALSGLDFMVAIDIYLNETTRHAHLILPPAAGLEVMHYDFVLGIVALRNVANFSAPVLPIRPGMRFDWQILLELQKRMSRSLQARLKAFILGLLSPERRIDLGLRVGPYGKWGGRLLKKNGLTLARLKAHPHGMDFGPLTPMLPGRLFTAGRRISLVPANVVKDLPRVERLLKKDTPPGFLLIGRRDLLSNNSWMHNAPRLMKTGDRCTLHIHPGDARQKGIEEGQWVRVSTATGAVTIRASLTEDIMPGVVSIPHGWGHDKKGSQLDLARQYPGVNINQLTDHRFIDEMSGNAAFSGTPVLVEPIFSSTSEKNDHVSEGPVQK